MKDWLFDKLEEIADLSWGAYFIIYLMSTAVNAVIKSIS